VVFLLSHIILSLSNINIDIIAIINRLLDFQLKWGVMNTLAIESEYAGMRMHRIGN
jgi:hypothetical protein